MNRITLWAAALTSLAFLSCTRQGGELPAAEVETTFVVSVPAAAAITTRAIDGRDDNEIKSITVLLFGADGKYVDRISGADITPDGATSPRVRFSVMIPVGNYSALLLANATEQIGGFTLTPGTTTIDELSGLSYTLAGKYNADPHDAAYKPFVMSSARIVLTVPNSTDYAANPIELVRDVAKINLDLTGALGNFTLEEVRLANYATRAYAFPTPAWWSADAPLFGSVVRPLAPADIAAGGAAAISYTSEIAGNGIVDEIFTPERPADNTAPENNLFLLIGGEVVLDGITYPNRWFKLALRVADAGDGDVMKYVDILRNHAYTVTVTGVGNTGWSTAAEAYDHPAEGIEATVAVSDESGLSEAVSNGYHLLAVDRSALTFVVGGESKDIQVFTDYPGGWTVDRLDGNDDGWITAPAPGTTAGTAGAVAPLTVTAGANTTGAPRTGRIHLRAGNLVKIITVEQAGS